MNQEYEINLELIDKLALQRSEQNLRFRSRLKEEDPDRLDGLFAKWHDQIAPHFDCRTCGNCCKSLQAPVTTMEAEQLATALRVSTVEFCSRHLTRTPAYWIFSQHPCTLLNGTECSAYVHRPASCRSYPHLKEAGMRDRLYSVLDNYGICPIVFNVVERLKEELHFDGREEG